MDAQAELAKRTEATSLEQLAEQRIRLDEHLVKVRASEYEFVQADLAERIATNLITVIEDGGSLSDAARATVRAAVTYFVASHDAEDDLLSPIGFEDDAFVVNEALTLIGRADLVVSVLEP